MRAVPGLIAKGGAEGLMAMAAPGIGAVVIKVDDGAIRPLRPILVSALTRLGVGRERLEPFAALPVTGGADIVGAVTAVW
jgi:L-asparaginase II